MSDTAARRDARPGRCAVRGLTSTGPVGMVTFDAREGLAGATRDRPAEHVLAAVSNPLLGANLMSHSPKSSSPCVMRCCTACSASPSPRLCTPSSTASRLRAGGARHHQRPTTHRGVTLLHRAPGLWPKGAAGPGTLTHIQVGDGGDRRMHQSPTGAR